MEWMMVVSLFMTIAVMMLTFFQLTYRLNATWNNIERIKKDVSDLTVQAQDKAKKRNEEIADAIDNARFHLFGKMSDMDQKLGNRDWLPNTFPNVQLAMVTASSDGTHNMRFYPIIAWRFVDIDRPYFQALTFCDLQSNRGEDDETGIRWASLPFLYRSDLKQYFDQYAGGAIPEADVAEYVRGWIAGTNADVETDAERVQRESEQAVIDAVSRTQEGRDLLRDLASKASQP